MVANVKESVTVNVANPVNAPVKRKLKIVKIANVNNKLEALIQNRGSKYFLCFVLSGAVDRD